MQTLVFLSCFVFFCSAQVGDEIAVDLFNYSSNATNSWNGGSGFERGWRAGDCVQTALPPDVTPGTFTRFATTSMIGPTSTGQIRKTCIISRTVSDSGAYVGGRFVSVLLVRRQAVPASPVPTTPTFGVAIGDLNSGEAWTSDLDLRDGWFGIRGEQATSTQLWHQVYEGDRIRLSGTLDSSTLAYFVVCESELRAPFRQMQARCAVMDPHKAVTREQARMPPSVPFSLPARWAISIGVSDFFVAQVLVGKTFESVYDKVPSAPTTTTSTTTTAMPPRITITTTTTKATTSLTINPKLTTTTSISTMAASDSKLTTTTSISTTAASGMLPTTTTSPSLSPSSCQSATTCLACVELAHGCKWCERWRNASTDANQCIAELDSECLTLTLSTDGCGTNNNQMMDESSLPVAIIAGAIGGGVALLLLIALVVCLTMRSLRNQQATARAASSSTEMVTARESISIAHTDETYGDLRLTSPDQNIYNTAGLTLSTTQGGSVKSVTTGASGSGSGGDPHYSPMKMH